MLLSLPVLIDGPREPHQHEVPEIAACLPDGERPLLYRTAAV